MREFYIAEIGTWGNYDCKRVGLFTWGGGDITRFYCMPKIDFLCTSVQALKDKDYCPIEIIKGLTDKGQFQYLTKLMGPQVGNYLYTTQFLSLR